MSTATFDTYAAAKADIARLETRIDVLRTEFDRALWIQGAGTVAVLAALRFLSL